MVLRGVAGLVAGSDSVSLDDWMRAADQLQLQDFNPGIEAVALARYATSQTVEAQLQAIRKSGRERFRMYPPGVRDEYLIVDASIPSMAQPSGVGIRPVQRDVPPRGGRGGAR
ncbi:hypothetical protein SSTU70S_00114 [Stutzerimonas stutzeri]